LEGKRAEFRSILRRRLHPLTSEIELETILQKILDTEAAATAAQQVS
jgi:hypothetical protein